MLKMESLTSPIEISPSSGLAPAAPTTMLLSPGSALAQPLYSSRSAASSPDSAAGSVTDDSCSSVGVASSERSSSECNSNGNNSQTRDSIFVSEYADSDVTTADQQSSCLSPGVSYRQAVGAGRSFSSSPPSYIYRQTSPDLLPATQIGYVSIDSNIQFHASTGSNSSAASDRSLKENEHTATVTSPVSHAPDRIFHDVTAVNSKQMPLNKDRPSSESNSVENDPVWLQKARQEMTSSRYGSTDNSRTSTQACRASSSHALSSSHSLPLKHSLKAHRLSLSPLKRPQEHSKQVQPRNKVTANAGAPPASSAEQTWRPW